MATTFVIACPECAKQVKVSDEHLGKKVKCKQCGAIYPVTDPASAPTASATATQVKGPPTPGKAKATQAKTTQVKGPPAAKKATQAEPPAAPARPTYADDDEEGPAQYVLAATDDNLPRCPFCAKEMESVDALICLNCGYNTRTRQRPEVKTVYQNTGLEVFVWLLPGIMCFLTMIGLLIWYIVFWMHIERWMDDSFFEDEIGPPKTYLAGLSPGFCRLYMFLIIMALYVPLFRIGYKRLVKNNKRPEKKIKDE